MKSVWAVSDSIFSPLGLGTEKNFSSVVNGLSGVRQHVVNGQTIMAAALSMDVDASLTRFEKACVTVLDDLFSTVEVERDRTLFILSTTKGNTELLDSGSTDVSRMNLASTARSLSNRFGFARAIVISNACISGVLALITAKRFLENESFDHAVILGADVLSNFIVSGFQSLLALSDDRCRPFDAHRKGLNLGEGAAAVLLTTRPELFDVKKPVRLSRCGISNDANHISGPSRTGEELAMAIRQATHGLKPDFISSHGTATLYNDEMEAKAFNLAEVADVSMSSLKAYYGHTLGAAGVIESIICMEALRGGVAIANSGYEESGTSVPLNVCRKTEPAQLNKILKTASGFGGCNAALTLELN